ncbi:unnamed protein product [Albugo candida]|uniref:PH domain-containing protein n=1 Tax=Albugo candida TaxID=65357 RepID=A0A024GKS4_9STRA|nr:unnamed protein product [Albugo candida]|eukprot:CCI47145.1 unnamed protein product [Albugo candida]
MKLFQSTRQYSKMTHRKGSNSSASGASTTISIRRGQYSGWIFKQGSLVRSWKKRYMVLKGRQLSYYDTDNILSLKVKEKGSFQVITVELSNEIKNGLLVHGRGGRILKLYTETTEEASGWYNAIIEATVISVETAVAIAAGRTSRAGSLGSNETALSVDGCTRDSQMAHKICLDSNDVTELLDQSDLQNNDEIEIDHTGWLWKEGCRFKSWKKRYFVLRGNSLAYFASEDTGGASAKGFGRVCAVEVNGQRNNCLDIRFESGRLLRIVVDTQDEMEEWLCKLSDAAHVSNIERRRDSLFGGVCPVSRASVPYLKSTMSPPPTLAHRSYDGMKDKSFGAVRDSVPHRLSLAYLPSKESLPLKTEALRLGSKSMSSSVSEFDNDDDSDGDWI